MSDSTKQALTVGMAIGGVLVLLGILAYVITDFASITALIPAFFGAVFVAIGALGDKTVGVKPALYALGGLSALAIAGSLRGVPDMLELVTGGSVDAPVAVGAQGAMILCSLIVLVFVFKALATDH
ncbi:hypothetical protein OB919_13805 [Halobacteria archaeon AArc-curdl1]|uniref:Uncharacterized protein n=1 Tax=Natronosalvus hydrolyticus TaxID=2979988 RepID=A0AAP2Z9F0_9EURY|nr:hypothetical protein [Halobacteria archaeon AArc-curdl1]